MGFFQKLFQQDEVAVKAEKVRFPWNNLSSSEQLKEIETASEFKGVLIFKHSTRCGISRMVLKRFEKEFEISNKGIELYLLDLLNHRDLSEEIASRYNVMHESPQILVLRNKIVAHQASHQAIIATELQFV